MKRSRIVTVSLCTLLGIGCDEDNADVRRCIDNQTQKVIDDKFCVGDAGVTRVDIHEHNNASGPAVIYHPVWYFGGGGFDVGTRVSGGATTPSVGRVYHPVSSFKSGVVRGGFGTTAAARFSGGS